MKKTVAMLVFGSLLAVSLMAVAGDDEKAKNKYGVQQLSGTMVEKRVMQMLQGVDWYGSFNDAVAAAAEEARPVFWVQLVGELDGGL
ncbi:MAG TPA: hypothetical protein EYN79_04315 [Planctomycetes bacterium]|nr:hypothetical protein [Planctomycetota bacterium]HIN80023.1 hypothetical protein [Planctomycetota bacterium]